MTFDELIDSAIAQIDWEAVRAHMLERGWRWGANASFYPSQGQLEAATRRLASELGQLIDEGKRTKVSSGGCFAIIDNQTLTVGFKGMGRGRGGVSNGPIWSASVLLNG